MSPALIAFTTSWSCGERPSYPAGHRGFGGPSPPPATAAGRGPAAWMSPGTRIRAKTAALIACALVPRASWLLASRRRAVIMAITACLFAASTTRTGGARTPSVNPIRTASITSSMSDGARGILPSSRPGLGAASPGGGGSVVEGALLRNLDYHQRFARGRLHRLEQNLLGSDGLRPRCHRWRRPWATAAAVCCWRGMCRHCTSWTGPARRQMQLGPVDVTAGVVSGTWGWVAEALLLKVPPALPKSRSPVPAPRASSHFAT